MFLGRSTWRVYVRWDRTRIERNEAEARFRAAEIRRERLEEEVARLKTERGWEEEIRRNFQVAKPGEGVIIIIDDEDSKGR